MLVGFGQVSMLGCDPFLSVPFLVWGGGALGEAMELTRALDDLPPHRSEMRRLYVEHCGSVSERTERPKQDKEPENCRRRRRHPTKAVQVVRGRRQRGRWTKG